MNDGAVNHCLQQAEQAYAIWRGLPFNVRAVVLNRTAELLLRDQQELARLITFEMGKVIPESMAEIEKCAWVCRYYADHTESFLADTNRDAGFRNSFITYEPAGAILGIMPWNFPFWQVFRYAASNLMAGNVTLLKHAPNVCGCSKKIESLLLEAGAPEGVFQSLIIDTAQVEQVIASPVVQGVTLTGSNRAGSAVAALAGKYTKKTVLELGGSDALLVLADADMQQAATTALQSRMHNAGQTCISAKRFIVVQQAADAFMQELLKGIRLLKAGNPFDSGITTGPLARPDLSLNLQRQLEQSVQQGAQLIHGGSFHQCQAEPSLLLHVQPGMPAFDEETFGPVACVTIVPDETAAIALANQSRFGLAASIWSSDLDKATAMARQLEAGNVFINSPVKSDPRLPFGGIKESGYGRELGREGLLEFVNVKTIAVG